MKLQGPRCPSNLIGYFDKLMFIQVILIYMGVASMMVKSTEPKDHEQ